MNYQPQRRPDISLEPLPEPSICVHRLMLATSLVVDSPFERESERFAPALANCLYMPAASLLIGGTGCRRPLLLREAADISAATSLDVLIVRTIDNSDEASFDMQIAGEGRRLCAFRMWMPRPSEAAWLIPTGGEEVFVRLTSLGLEVTDRVPFIDQAERHIGLLRGQEFLSVAVKGWF
jgi:hypothetical protein